ncbi:MAG: hypothetical protein OEZ01_00980 [Candidatus Heimdallarchaeota archaeon]|nr:hypothetical protein [Candidatus Heimdallarchaeota archaeon]MDH5644547.1 hypothetical protein [Candidatus Heimdallarchaeota archaeon]
MFDLPVGFYKLPDLSNLSIKPPDPYTFDTTGVIHSSKFDRLIQMLMITSPLNEHELREIFDGHRLQANIIEFSKNKLVDFSIHILIANKNKIGWQKIDEIIEAIGKRFVPTWNLPDFKFNKGFIEIFSTIIQWDLDDETVEILSECIKVIVKFPLTSFEFREKIDAEYRFWSIKNILLIYDSIIDFHLNKKNHPLTKHLQNVITNIENRLITEIEDGVFDLYQRTALILLFTRIYVKTSNDAIITSQELIDKAWRNIEKLSKQEISSLKYLFGASYSYLIKSFLETHLDYITKTKLIGRLVSNYINPQELDLDMWFKSLNDGNFDPYVILYIYEGYLSTIPVLIEQWLELPTSDTKNILAFQIGDISKILHISTLEYIYHIFNIPKITETTVNDFIKRFERSKAPAFIKERLVNVILKTFIYISHTDQKIFNLEEYNQHINLYLNLSNTYKSKEEHLLFEIELKLLLNRYPFDSIMQNIVTEATKSSSIILSTTFETEIIRKISQIMEFLLEKLKNQGKVDIQAFERLIYFLGEWLHKFKTSGAIYHDVLMILSPIISICQIQIARGYYEDKKIVKAFLTYINMHYFVLLFMDEVKQSDSWITKNGSSSRNIDVMSEFRELMKDWNIGEFFNIKSMKSLASNLEFSFQQSRIGGANFDGMIQDDIILGFMDLQRLLEEFLQEKLEENNHNITIKEKLLELEIFNMPKKISYNVMEKIGFNSIKSKDDIVPFPVVKNVHEYATAIEIFPLEIDIGKFSDSKIYNSFIDLISESGEK